MTEKTISVESTLHTSVRLPDGSVIAGSPHGAKVVTNGLDAGAVRDWLAQNEDQPCVSEGLIKIVAPEEKAEIEEAEEGNEPDKAPKGRPGRRSAAKGN